MKSGEAKLGDTVKLNSGGPLMTITGILQDGRLVVTWYTDGGQSGWNIYSPEVVVAAKPDK